jgi:hypothetical protein
MAPTVTLDLTQDNANLVRHALETLADALDARDPPTADSPVDSARASTLRRRLLERRMVLDQAESNLVLRGLELLIPTDPRASDLWNTVFDSGLDVGFGGPGS